MFAAAAKAFKAFRVSAHTCIDRVHLHFRQTSTYGTVSYGSVANVTTLQTSLLTELQPVVAANLDRHLSLAKDWQPQDYVPWSRGRDFAFLGGTDWQPEDSPLDPVAQTAMIVNLLTEDNLPSYHREIATRFGRDGAWGQWVGRWTAEEGRHAIAIRDYLVVTRGVDPVRLEALRMEHMTAGYDSGDKTMLQALAYVSFQELATRIAHRNTGRATGCPLAEQLLARISADENLHMVFYRNLVKAALDLSPGPTLRAITDEVISFQMPCIAIPGFARKAAQIARAGIYDLRIHHDEVIWPLLRQWGVFELENLDAQGEKARIELAGFLTQLDGQASRFEERRAQASNSAARSGVGAVPPRCAGTHQGSSPGPSG